MKSCQILFYFYFKVATDKLVMSFKLKNNKNHFRWKKVKKSTITWLRKCANPFEQNLARMPYYKITSQCLNHIHNGISNTKVTFDPLSITCLSYAGPMSAYHS